MKLASYFLGPRVAGQVDHTNDSIVRGWAWIASQPGRRLVLEVFYRDVFLGHAFAAGFREDLAANGIGDGHHAFVFHMPADVPKSFDPNHLSVVTAGPHRFSIPLPPVHSAQLRKVRRLPADPRAIFRPYLLGLRAEHIEPPGAETGERPRIDILCREGSVPGLSEFICHIARKYGRRLVSSADVLSWYLEVYAVERGPTLAPLAACDLQSLDHRTAPSQAYEWTAEIGPRLFIDDCLWRPGAQRASLPEVAAGPGGQTFPVTDAMRRMCTDFATLRRFSTNRLEDRHAIYALLMAMALRRPALLDFLPSGWALEYLASGAFTTTLARLFGPDCAIEPEVYRARIEAKGFSFVTFSLAGHFYKDHRVLNGSTLVGGPPSVDVQVFGPLRSKSGLGESCRRLIEALKSTSLTLNVVDYSLGQVGAATGSDQTSRPPCRARVNILHLNLEEIPEAFAYLPDVFAGAPVIAVPYWELDKPATVHRLGLRLVDEIWVASNYLSNVFSGLDVPVRWIGMAFDARPLPRMEECRALLDSFSVPKATFVFLTTSDARSWGQRKNPLGVIAAFQAAFSEEDVTLIVKTHSLDAPMTAQQQTYWHEIRRLAAADRRIVFIDASFSAAEQRALLGGCDCLVSLHRAEGLGLDVLDAAGAGIAIVATDYSGVTDICTPDTAWTVAADIVPVKPDEYAFAGDDFVWAEPRHAAAVEALQAVFANGSKRAWKVALARKKAAETASEKAFAARLEVAVRDALAAFRA